MPFSTTPAGTFSGQRMNAGA
ncbi:MAG: hypothetical protein HW393_456, partial [Dehalococcoidia bacterium]|nr:hypothetical protein [Dehalococcoidia bacterium]